MLTGRDEVEAKPCRLQSREKRRLIAAGLAKIFLMHEKPERIFQSLLLKEQVVLRFGCRGAHWSL